MAVSKIAGGFSRTPLASNFSTDIYRTGNIAWIRFSTNETIAQLKSAGIPARFRPRTPCYITVTVRSSNDGFQYPGRVLLNQDGSMQFYYIGSGSTITEIASGTVWSVYGSGAYII